MKTARTAWVVAIACIALAASTAAVGSGVRDLPKCGDLHDGVGQADCQEHARGSQLRPGATYKASRFPISVRLRAPDARWKGAQYDSGTFRFVQLVHLRTGSTALHGFGFVTLEAGTGKTGSVARAVARLRATPHVQFGAVTPIRVAGFSGQAFDATIVGSDRPPSCRKHPCARNVGVSLAPFGRNHHCGYCGKTMHRETQDVKVGLKDQLLRIIVLGVRGKTVVIYLESSYHAQPKHLPSETFPTFLPYAQRLLATLRFPGRRPLAATFARPRNGKIAFVGRSNTLDVIEPDGSGHRRLARCPETSCQIAAYAWSPNGKHLAFVRGHLGGAVTRSNLSLFVVDARGKRVRRLVRCGGSCHVFWAPSHLSWSPDSTRIVLARDDGIAVVSLVPGQTTQLTDSPTDFAPAWSPDGARIAFARGNSLYSIRPDGSGLSKLATIYGHVGAPAWAPDRTTIVFDTIVLDNTPEQIYVVGSRGSHLRLLRSGTRGSTPAEPSWSPDGRHIAFFNLTERDGRFAAGEVWTMRPDGSKAQPLYRSHCCVGEYAGSQHGPVWSPNGNRIAFSLDLRSGRRSPGGGSFVMRADGSERRRLLPWPPSELAWQPIPRSR